MHIYLPIAAITVNLFSLLSIGFIAGILSGILGIGGGIITTPALMSLGIPPAVAVASATGQIIASTSSASLVYAKIGKVDFRVATILIICGVAGAILGSFWFNWAEHHGHIDKLIKIAYIVTLGGLGGFMLLESIKSILNRPKNVPDQILPSGQSKSSSKKNLAILISTGGVAGVLAAIMGIGGGFIVIPSLIYLLKMSTEVAIGTSAFQVVFISITAMILQVLGEDVNIDLILSVSMILSSVIGAQIGSRLLANKIKPEYKRMMIASIAIIIVIKMSCGLYENQNLDLDVSYSAETVNVGLNLLVSDLANEHGLIYAMIIIFIAIVSGWLFNIILRSRN